MSAKVLDGTAIAKKVRLDVKERVSKLKVERDIHPCLTVILVGDNPASSLYVRLKKRDCEETGIRCHVTNLPKTVATAELGQYLQQLNENVEVHGILLQLPLPDSLDTTEIIEHIQPRKDVDGITPFNLGMLTLRQPAHRCCTPKGVMTLLRHTNTNLMGLNAVVIGASNHVGRPMCLELLMAGCTVTVCHRHSRDTQAHARRADILVTATGKGGLIRRDWVKPGAIVIDIGIETQADGSLQGDVDFESVREIASWITPVPGGVGPMTRVSILQNLLDAVESLDE
ncbi:MAG: bifunctional methylenetetrahydrofolate dehydrogenase/methenyltetrahydrofolate cyclohydrolase FolD [Gammaproteobacteria bacterium]|nr:bifunctional methylenetetrahydrofolate dehydrogenase/methenyltetrahydrofolate cyclohydrolase FolD [Gammaproteobacteria bacterium]